tara:strand:+ start:297 stop:545 length:249 start_codon:yes stop_codon:yes gene_type:complete
MEEYEYDHDGVKCTVDYIYDKGEPDQWYDQNGDPGTPGYGPTVEVLNVWAILTDRLGNNVSVKIDELLYPEDIEEEILRSKE